MKQKKGNKLLIRRDYRIGAVLLLSLALIAGGINLLVSVPAGGIALYAGSFIMISLGSGGFIASYLRRQETWLPLGSLQKMMLGGCAFCITLFGVAMTVLSAGDLKWSGSGLQTVCFALIIIAGALSLILILDSQREFTLEGFFFITGEPYAQRWGLTGLRHVYEGDRLGIPLSVSITVGAPDAHGAPRYVIEAVCLIDNPLAISLLACPERFHAWPAATRLPRIHRVPHWENFTVRGAPADLVARIIAPFRKHVHTVFSDTYGFERVRVSGNKVRARFVLETKEKHRITDIVEGLVFFSGHFN